jgi:hypothetical protein
MVFSARAATKDAARSWRRRTCTLPRFSSTLPADFGDGDNPSARHGLDWSAIGCVLFQPEMRSTFMIIRNISCQHASQMRLAEDDDVIQTLATHGSDQSLRKRILPRT